jgi:predicted ATPase
MITYIKINGFKSFQNFEMEFTPLTVIAGTNASGKSNLFDALLLLSRLADSDKLQSAFREQRGEMAELFTQYDEEKSADEMSFLVEMLVNKKVKDAWGAEVELKYTRLRYGLKIRKFVNELDIDDLEVIEESLENLKHQDDKWIKIIPKEKLERRRPKVISGKRGRPYIFTENTNGIPTVVVPQDGVQGGNKRSFPLIKASRTVLSSFDSVDFRHILAAKEEMKSWKFLQLNPEDLRQPTSKKTGEDVIGSSGKNLAAALFRIFQQDNYSLVEISRKLNSFLPEFVEVKVIDDKENKQYLIHLKGADLKEYSSRVLSEGTLRILALCILEFDERHTGLLCFEEPENGIHPYRIKAIANLIKDLTVDFEIDEIPLRQVIVNTHSPVLINEVIKWKNEPSVSIHFSQMSKRIIEIQEGKKVRINVTKILPVKKEFDNQTSLVFSEQDRKLTISTVKEYLQTADLEDSFKIIGDL